MNESSPYFLIEEIIDYLHFLSESGVRELDCSPENLKRMEQWGKPVAPARESLASIRNEVENCKKCNLFVGRRRVVFGKGDPKARLVFIGEAPGREEDREGEPFVGEAGKLLTKIIEAMNLTRDQVYIMNIVKCRPPNNRNPLPDEINACLPFLKRQIKAIQPEFICALGAVAAQTLLDTQTPVSKLRGRFHPHSSGAKVMPTFHPASLLRNPQLKRDVWEDIKKVMAACKYPE